MRKSGVKKISVKTKKKEVKRKVGTALKSPQKTANKKKQTKSVASKVKEKKIPPKKRETKVKIQVKGEKKQKKIEVKPGIATKKAVPKKAVPKKAVPKRTIKKTPAKAPLKTFKKAEAPKKTEKPSKTIKVKTTAKPDRKEKAKKIKKTTKKISEKPQKKITSGKTEKSKASKLLIILPKKLVASRVKKKEPEKIKKPEKVEQVKAVRETLARKKLPPQKLSEVKQIKKAEVLKEAKDLKVVPELKEIKADTIPTGYRPAEVPFPPVPLETLPSEYGENGIILMTVNPYKLFAFWEVRKETLNVFKGKLTLRVYDVTDIDFDSMKANSFLDIAVRERVGKTYVNVSPSKEYIADIGIVYNGIFITIARSPKVSTPGAGIPTAEEFLQEIFDDSIRVGY
jgi:hypothetical protein